MTIIYERIYKKLETLGVLGVLEAGRDSAKSKASGFMDLSLDILHEEEPGVVRIALAHYFEQNGDLCADPDMEIRIYKDRRMAEALTFQQAFPPIYQEVYPEPDKYYPQLKKELNAFLDQWLKNCLGQGHSFKTVSVSRAQALNVIWKNKHKDYKGIGEDGHKRVLVLRDHGTMSVRLDRLTDDEITNLLPKEFRIA